MLERGRKVVDRVREDSGRRDEKEKKKNWKGTINEGDREQGREKRAM